MLSAVPEVALGLSFLFFVLSPICSALDKAIAAVFWFDVLTHAAKLRGTGDEPEDPKT